MYVNDIGKLAYDCWQRVEYVFDTLVWREKAKGEQDGAPFHTKFVLRIIRIGKGHVGNAVRDQIDLVNRGLINIAEKLNTLFGHGHDTSRELNHFLKDPLLFDRGVVQNRMQGGYHRHPEISQ